MSLNKYFKFNQPRPNPNFPRRTYYAMAPNDIWQLDLVALNQKGDIGGVGSRGGVHKEEGINLQQGKGSGNYILNVIDVYSRRLESITIDSKSGESIMEGLKKLFVKMNGKPHKIQADQEKGLWAKEKELNKIGINLYTVKNAYDGTNSAPIVERVQRDQNNYMYKHEVDNPNKSNKAISEFVANNFPKYHNERKHRTIQSTPNDAFYGKTSTKDILSAVFNYSEHKPQPKRQINKDLNVGDLVYIPKPETNREIERKNADKWYREPHKIIEITRSKPPQFILEGTTQKYYREQLRHATI